MKYVRKITVIVIVLAFLVALSVGLGFIYSVKNVNVSLATYYELSENADGEEVDDITQSVDYGRYKADYDGLKKSLDKFKGTLLAFVDKSDISSAIKDSGYSLASYEKIMPCTLNVTFKQRVETFGVRDGERYIVYDEDGVFMKTSDTLDNDIDGTQDVLLSSYDGSLLTDESVAHVADICAVFRTEFKAFRYVVDSVIYNVNENIEFYIDVITFRMRTGVEIRISDFEVMLPEKIAAAHAKYSSLSAEEKLHGTISVSGNDRGEVNNPSYQPGV